jgi:hypothetical protein
VVKVCLTIPLIATNHNGIDILCDNSEVSGANSSILLQRTAQYHCVQYFDIVYWQGRKSQFTLWGLGGEAPDGRGLGAEPLVRGLGGRSCPEIFGNFKPSRTILGNVKRL